MNAMQRYRILSSFDRVKIKRELGEDYRTLKEVHEAQCRAFDALSAGEKAMDYAEAAGELERHAGRPLQGPAKRLKICYSISPETAAAIEQDRCEGESKGTVLDRWARERTSIVQISPGEVIINGKPCKVG